MDVSFEQITPPNLLPPDHKKGLNMFLGIADMMNVFAETHDHPTSHHFLSIYKNLYSTIDTDRVSYLFTVTNPSFQVEL